MPIFDPHDLCKRGSMRPIAMICDFDLFSSLEMDEEGRDAVFYEFLLAHDNFKIHSFFFISSSSQEHDLHMLFFRNHYRP